MLQLSAEVREALDRSSAVVALESTVIAQGLPWPRNREVGQMIEDVVREAGAVPATVAVIGGAPRVGLSADEIARIASPGAVRKLSTRELPVAIARGADGATTVAATMFLARAAGIDLFATGGIGGVHRGPLPDVSADITELGRTPMIVVCAGAKAILDLPATREALETAGVLIVGWRTDELPAFYSRASGLGVDVRVESAGEVAELWAAHRQFELPGALLLCVPPPAGQALEPAEVEQAISRALARAGENGVRGGEVTPFLLRAVAEETGGRSTEVNVALLRENARVAAEVAVAVAALPATDPLRRPASAAGAERPARG